MSNPYPDRDESQMQEFTRWLAQLRVEVSHTVNGVLQRGSRPVPIRSAGTPVKVMSSPGVLAGWMLCNLEEDERTAVEFYDGDADGDFLCRVTLSPGESIRETFFPGVNLSRGLYVSVTAGAVLGSVLIGGVE